MSSRETKKGGFFQKLFGRDLSRDRRRDIVGQEDRAAPGNAASGRSRPDAQSPTITKLAHGGVATSQAVTAVKPTKDTTKTGISSGRRPATGGKGVGSCPSGRQGRQNRGSKGSGSKRSRRRRKKKPPIDLNVDTSRPLTFPTTPEMILAYHKAKTFLDKTEEWIVVSLNEYECMLDSLEIVRIMGKHSQFFEVEPEDLCEEFFDFVEDIPSYDEVINEDIWQEFRYAKYNW